jgi:hypothetical protein
MKLDGNGWRIPRRTTQAHEIYLRCLRGLNPSEIAGELSLTQHQVDVVIWRLKNPGAPRVSEPVDHEHEEDGRGNMISEHGAQRLASRIRDYWVGCGYLGIVAEPVVLVHAVGSRNRRLIWSVRTNIGPDGFPPRLPQ